jgi:type I restriction enzyme S subunit
MTTIGTISPPRAFAIKFAGLERWDPTSYHRIDWHWPHEGMRPIGDLFTVRTEKVDRKRSNFSDLMPITIHFDGSVDPRKIDTGREYSMDLFWARPGDVVVAKIDLKNGAVAVIPNDWNDVVVTSHFAVYEPRLDLIDPSYFHRVIQADFFKAHLWRNKVGAEGRKEVKLDFFEELEIPVPPLPLQRAILRCWHEANREANRLDTEARETETAAERRFVKALGLPLPSTAPPAKSFALRWSDVKRWSLSYNQAVARQVDLNVGKYQVRELRSLLTRVQYGTSEKANTQGVGAL